MIFNQDEVNMLKSYGFVLNNQNDLAHNNVKYPECNKTVQITISKIEKKYFLRELTDAWNNPYPGIPDGYFINIKDCLENSCDLKKFTKLSELKKFLFLNDCVK